MATDTTTKKADLSDILKQLNLMDSNKPLNQTELTKIDAYLRQPNIDFANATDDELGNYQNALDYFNKAQVVSPDTNKLEGDIFKRIDELEKSRFHDIDTKPGIGRDDFNGYGDKSVLANKIKDALVNSNSGYLKDVPNELKGLANEFQPLLDNGKYNQVTAGTGVFDDTLKNNQTNVGGLLSGRKQVASDSQLVQDYLAQAPQKLGQARSEFYNQQRSDANDYLKSTVIPKNLEPIERSGLSSDREVAQMIANLYGGVQTSLDQSETSQAISDVNFFSDAAYKTKLQDLVNSRADVQGQLNSDFNTARTNQSQGFNKVQTNLKNDFDTNLFKQQNEQALSQYQAKLQQQKDSQSAANQANLWTTVAGTVANVAGSALVKNFGSATDTGAEKS